MAQGSEQAQGYKDFPNCLILTPTVVDDKENLWFLDALKHSISKLILTENIWSKKDITAPESALGYNNLPKLPPVYIYFYPSRSTPLCGNNVNVLLVQENSSTKEQICYVVFVRYEKLFISVVFRMLSDI